MGLVEEIIGRFFCREAAYLNQPLHMDGVSALLRPRQ